jgi:hypothetical protein
MSYIGAPFNMGRFRLDMVSTTMHKIVMYGIRLSTNGAPTATIGGQRQRLAHFSFILYRRAAHRDLYLYSHRIKSIVL